MKADYLTEDSIPTLSNYFSRRQGWVHKESGMTHPVKPITPSWAWCKQCGVPIRICKADESKLYDRPMKIIYSRVS